MRRAIMVLVLGMSGCFVATDGVPQMLIGSKVLDGGTQCPNGGKLVQAGLDTNGDGVLNPTEVTSNVPMCDSVTQVVLPASTSAPEMVVQSGHVDANFIVDKDWNLIDPADAGYARSFEKPIVFPVPFSKAPSVTIGLTEIDLGTTGTRVRVSAESVTPSKFTLRVGTWAADSSLWGVKIDWLAYAQ